MKSFALAAGLAAFLAVSGCIRHRTISADRSVTAGNAQSTNPQFWLAQPASATVTSHDFDALWEAARSTARSYLFQIDRVDPRSGVMTTEPMVSAQWHEPWRREIRTVQDSINSSLSTHRRTITFLFDRVNENAWTMTPKVVVERYSQAERRVTAVSQTERLRLGSDEKERTLPDGRKVPTHYWYAVGRDTELEQHLAREIERRATRLAMKK